MFTLQLLLLITAIAASMLLLLLALRHLRGLRRLPAACHLQDLEIRVAAREADLAALGTRYADLMQEHARQQAKLDLIQGKLAELTGFSQSLKDRTDTQERLLAERTRAAAALEGVEKHLILLEQACKTQENDHTQLKEQKTALEAEFTKLRSSYELLAARHKYIEEENSSQERLLEERTRAAAELDGVEKRLSAAEQEFATKRESLFSLQKDILTEKEALEKIETTHRKSRIEIQTMIVERDALIKQMESLERHIEGLRQLADKTAAQLGEKPGEDRYRDLWKPILFPKLLKPAESAPAEKDALAQTERHLQSLGFHFPKRTLNAFHTALKTADLSPITVLAGISGTGKSELPKRYAEAMGIHFVGLPVQPRWDSPTDLFGFFNHLEGRFKATDLARAMAQFERHNREDWPLPKAWNHGMENQMLLVLLDEMNLARVEYYFSDFLSRLETRRGVINMMDAGDRAKAELALDMGSLGKDEKPIRFFPDRNVLFTGTMNEDESTQTLSDKVLDRACVLRFGRPKNLASAKKAANLGPPAQALLLDHWNAWLGGKLEVPGLGDRIGQLNDAMEMMGRPFGHRVSQAMETYAAHYPSWEKDRVNLALADQIEQRILPKLRGMDTAQAEKPLKKIEDVLKSTGDETLLAAFQAGRTESAFLWRGVDRGQ